MLRTIFALLLGSVLLGTATAAYAASAQSLVVDVRDRDPQLSRLSHYSASAPVELRVIAPGASSVALVGASPAGTTVRVPLAAARDGSFTGTTTLAVPGTWLLAISTTYKGPEIVGDSFSVVVEQGASARDAAVLAVLAVLSIGGGIGLIVAGRGSAAQLT
jgi:hypothetical protein